MYNIKNDSNEEAIMDGRPQVIKRAKIFNDDDYIANLEQIES